MVPAQPVLPGREHIPELVLRPGMFPPGRHLLGDAELGGQRIRVIRPQRVLLIGQSLLL